MEVSVKEPYEKIIIIPFIQNALTPKALNHLKYKKHTLPGIKGKNIKQNNKKTIKKENNNSIDEIKYK